jgi:hypothetical protein
MAKNTLGKLFGDAYLLQEAAKKLTRRQRFDIYEKLNSIIMQILHEHLDKVQVRYAANRPQDWFSHLAVIEVVYGATILKIPVPELRALDWELSRKVRTTMADFEYSKISGGSSSFKFEGDLRSTGFAGDPVAHFPDNVVISVRISNEVRTKKEPLRGVYVEGNHMHSVRSTQIGLPVSVTAQPVKCEVINLGHLGGYITVTHAGAWIFQSPELEEGQWYLAVSKKALEAFAKLESIGMTVHPIL